MKDERASLIRHIADFLRSRQGEILGVWEDAIRRVPKANALDRPRLIDHLPSLLNRIADYVEETRRARDDGFHDASPEAHAIARLDEGYDLSEVILEYGLLRRSIFELLGRERQELSQPEELGLLNAALDEAVHAAVDKYTGARHKTIEALDRVAGVAFAKDVDTFLPEILRTVRDTTEAVDTVAVLLVEDGVLRRRAAVGLEIGEPVAKIGEGFAGRIAATRRPLLLKGDEIRKTALSPALRERGLRVVYGAPLTQDGEVIGVAHMGSQTAVDFSEQDKLILRSMAARATSLIAQSRALEALRDAREQAERTGALLDVLLDTAPIGLGFLDTDLRYVRVNRVLAEEIAGVPVAEHLAKRPSAVLPGLPADTEDRLRRVLETKEPVVGWEITATTPRFGAEPRHYLTSLYPVTVHEELIGVGVVVLDVTDRKRTEDELHKAVKARDEFVAVLTHDLRNPLGAIAMGATLLHQQLSPDQERLRKRAASIRTASERAARMVELLLQEVALEGGQVKLAKEPHDPRALLGEAYELHLPGAQERQIALELEAQEGLRPVLCDRDYVHRVLGNIIGNAKKYTPPGGKITLRAEPVARAVRFSVADTGPGIPPENLARLFERGFRGTRTETGLGLGLSIARSIVEAHGGEIGVASRVGRGTTFWFSLPLA